MTGKTRAIAAACIALVVFVHALILVSWRPSPVPTTSRSLDRMVLRWMSTVPRASIAPTPGAMRAEPLSPRRSAPSASSHDAPSASRAEASMPAREAAAAPTGEGASAPPLRPLDLTVRSSAHDAVPAAAAALADPRSNDRRASMGDVIARRIGADDRRREEVRADGSVRIRQGTSCLDARASRAAELDPFRGAERPAPRQISQCD